MRILAKLLVGAFALVLIAGVAGAGYQRVTAALDSERFPPPGQMVEVDGLQIHVDCRGSGEPLVLLEAGLTSGSTSWELVHDKIAEHTRVCAYDRPGMDWSEPVYRVTPVYEVASRLNQLVKATDLSGPYILLGMSAGGVYIREYYHRYPEDVVGMVLVDSSHEQQGLRLPKMPNDAEMGDQLQLCAWLQPLGVVRAGGVLDFMADQYNLSGDRRARFLALAYRSHACSSMRYEFIGFTGDVNSPSAPASLGDLPLIVLSQGKEPVGEELGMSQEAALASRKIWDSLQEELTALSTQGERRIARTSGHVIQLEEPQAVINAVVDLVERVNADVTASSF